MVCDLRQPDETPQEQRERIDRELAAMASGIAAGSVQIVIAEDGAIAFTGEAADRGTLTDACAYRLLGEHYSFELQNAISLAEAQQGRLVNPAAIAAGRHSHDGGQTWHAGH